MKKNRKIIIMHKWFCVFTAGFKLVCFLKIPVCAISKCWHVNTPFDLLTIR